MPISHPKIRGLKSRLKDTDITVQIEKAVWGKKAGSEEDYHWLRLTPGFIGSSENEIPSYIGPEAINAFGWKIFDNKAFAIEFRVSDIFDAQGRSGTLEKRFIQFDLKHNPELPIGIIGSALMKSMTDSDLQWQDGNRFNAEQINISVDKTLRDLDKGILAIRDSYGEKEVVEFYNDLLHPDRAATLDNFPTSNMDMFFSLSIFLPSQFWGKFSFLSHLKINPMINWEELSKCWSFLPVRLEQPMTSATDQEKLSDIVTPIANEIFQPNVEIRDPEKLPPTIPIIFEEQAPEEIYPLKATNNTSKLNIPPATQKAKDTQIKELPLFIRIEEYLKAKEKRILKYAFFEAEFLESLDTLINNPVDSALVFASLLEKHIKTPNLVDEKQWQSKIEYVNALLLLVASTSLADDRSITSAEEDLSSNFRYLDPLHFLAYVPHKLQEHFKQNSNLYSAALKHSHRMRIRFISTKEPQLA